MARTSKTIREAESTYDAAHLFPTRAKEHVIQRTPPDPVARNIFELTVNCKVHKVPGAKFQK